jgi:hypothetical protein
MYHLYFGDLTIVVSSSAVVWWNHSHGKTQWSCQPSIYLHSNTAYNIHYNYLNTDPSCNTFSNRTNKGTSTGPVVLLHKNLQQIPSNVYENQYLRKITTILPIPE